MSRRLYDSNSAMYVLGSLFHQPILLHEGKYLLTEVDFFGLHKIVFGALFNLSATGMMKITPLDVDLYLKEFPVQYEVYKKENGLEFCQTIYSLFDKDIELGQFERYYDRVRKFTILRDFDRNGIDIKEIYNPDVDFTQIDKENEKLNGISIDDIFHKIHTRVALIEERNVNRDNQKSINAGFRLRDLLTELGKSPEAGLPLEGEMLNFAARGARAGRLYLYSAPTGHGKALPNSTKIPLFKGGFKQVKDVEIGDELIDRHGKPTKVLGVYPQGINDIYEIKFKDGRVALSNLEHLWTYHYGDVRYNNLTTSTLKEIIEQSNKVGFQDRDGAFRFKVPFNSAVEYSKKDYSIDPYILGLFLGDGSFRLQEKSNKLGFSTKDMFLLEEIAKITGWEIVKYSGKNYSYYFRQNGRLIQIPEFLKDFPDLINKCSYEKFIPEEYFYGSIEQRISLLQGLLDSDGSVYKNKVRFTTSSEKLKNNFIQILYSLGYTASVERDNRGKHLVYTVQVGAKTTEKIKLFRLPRKIEKIDLTKRSEKYEYNAIIGIQKINRQEEMTCFLVDNDEHLFLMNDYIVTHNTRFLVGNACAISMPKIVNNKIIIPDNLTKVLFIATEMDPDEIQTLILAYVSGINEEKILTNTMTEEERRVLDTAILLIEQYSENFRIEKISDPDIDTVRVKITSYILNEDFTHIYYDYIFTSTALNKQFSRTGLREDVVLMMMANGLKQIASDQNVFIFSGTQVNREWERSQFRNENSLAGSKAIADKADFGVVAIKMTEEEKEKIEPLLIADGISERPNIVLDVYKNRRGRIVNAKIFRVFDYGTCRAKDLIVTDTNFNKWNLGMGQYKYGQQVKDLLEISVDKNEH